MKFKIIIGIVLFVILICAGYSATTFQSSSSGEQISVQVGNIEYKGKFLTPVENFNVVTSKYGARVHPITRQEQLSYRH